MTNPSAGISDIPKVVPAIGNDGANIESYRNLYAHSIENPNAFWLDQSKLLQWEKDPSVALSGGFLHGDVHWFADGYLNVSYNAIDRHVLAGKGDQVAMIFEGDEPDDIRRITYDTLQRQVCKIANALLSVGVKANDVVTIYMPMSTFVDGLLVYLSSHTLYTQSQNSP